MTAGIVRAKLIHGVHSFMTAADAWVSPRRTTDKKYQESINQRWMRDLYHVLRTLIAEFRNE